MSLTNVIAFPTTDAPALPGAGAMLLYKRISSDRRDTMGVKRQDKMGHDAMPGLGCTRVITFQDNDKSASNPSVTRPDFVRLLALIESGDVDGATVWCQMSDRLVRQGGESEAFLRLCVLHSIRVVCPGDGVDIRPEVDGALMWRFKAAINADEARKISVRVRAAHTQNRELGKRHGKLPFGWNPDDTLHPIEAPMVREAIDTILRGGSITALARQWNADPSKARLSYVKRTINGARLRDDEQTVITNEWDAESIGRTARRPGNARINMHKGRREPVLGAWAAICTEDEWMAVEAVFTGRTVRSRGVAPRHLLGGLLHCARCAERGVKGRAGNPVVLYGVTAHQDGYTYTIYSCGKCRQQVRIDKVDDYVLAYVIERLANLEPADLVSASKSAQLRSLTTKITALEARAAQAKTLFGTDVIDADELTDIIVPNRKEVARLNAERDVLLAEAGTQAALAPLIGSGDRAVTEAVWNDPATTLAHKRTAIRILARLTLNMGTRTMPMRDRVAIAPLV